MMPVHERLAELWTIREQRRLTAEEQSDFEHCLAVKTAAQVRKLASLYNLSLLASMTDDHEWQHGFAPKLRS